MRPKVSILIPCLNAAEWVGDAIRSALRQTYTNTQIVVVDDGSRDGTLEIVRSFGERIEWEARPHLGRNPARNRLLELSQGEWLQYLDADDVLLPNKIAHQIAAVAGADVELVVSPSLNEEGKAFRAPISQDPWECLLSVQMGVTSSNLFNKQAVEKAGGWDPARVAGQEYALMQAMLRQGARVAFAREPLVLKRSVNPKNLWKSDPSRAKRDSILNVMTAFRHLETTDELTPDLRQIAGRRLLRIARWYRLRGNPYYAEVLALANQVEPSQGATLPPLPRAYRIAHRMLGARVVTRVLRATRPDGLLPLPPESTIGKKRRRKSGQARGGSRTEGPGGRGGTGGSPESLGAPPRTLRKESGDPDA